jgi:hypothetical protein
VIANVDTKNCVFVYLGLGNVPNQGGLAGQTIRFGVIPRNAANETIASCEMGPCLSATLVSDTLTVPTKRICNTSIETPFTFEFMTTVRGKYNVVVLYGTTPLAGPGSCNNGGHTIPCNDWVIEITPCMS